MKKSNVRIIRLPDTPGGNTQRIAITSRGIRNVREDDGGLDGPTVPLSILVKIKEAIAKAVPIKDRLIVEDQAYFNAKKKLDNAERALRSAGAAFEKAKVDRAMSVSALYNLSAIESPHSVDFTMTRVSVGCKKLTYEQAQKMIVLLIAAVKRAKGGNKSRRSK